MKKFLCIALVIILSASFFACNKTDANIRNPVLYYYRTRDLQYGVENGVITAEVRERFGHEEDYTYLVEQYLNGPMSSECISPFPAGTSLEQIDFLKDKVLITLSSHISLLSGSELTIACTCLAKTLLEMTGMKEVRISSKNDLIDGQEYISIATEDIVLLDSDPINP